MIVVGIDDTDVADSRGTNQLARQIVREVSEQWRCVWIVRHQLLDDPRVPYTSKNGSASIALKRRGASNGISHSATCEQAAALLDCCRRVMREEFIEGSDPGLCLLNGGCPPEIVHWGRRCQRELVARCDALEAAREAGVHLEALGGTEDGVIGALAAVGLASTGDDGRIVQWGEWPDDLSGPQSVETLHLRGVRVRELDNGGEVAHGVIDVGKRLRPNLRGGAAEVFVERSETGDEAQPAYRAIRLT